MSGSQVEYRAKMIRWTVMFASLTPSNVRTAQRESGGTTSALIPYSPGAATCWKNSSKWCGKFHVLSGGSTVLKMYSNMGVLRSKESSTCQQAVVSLRHRPGELVPRLPKAARSSAVEAALLLA